MSGHPGTTVTAALRSVGCSVKHERYQLLEARRRIEGEHMLRMKMGLVRAAGCGAELSEVLTAWCQDDAITSPTITDELLPSVLQTAGTRLDFWAAAAEEVKVESRRRAPVRHISRLASSRW